MNLSLFSLLLLTCVVSVLANGRGWTGGCGSSLVDVLNDACGARGFHGTRMFFLMRRYPGLFQKRHPRTRRSLVDLKELFKPMDMGKTFTEAVIDRSQSHPVLSSMLRIGHEMDTERTVKRRYRRTVVSECCHNSCDLVIVKRKYCQRRYRGRY